MGVSIPYRYDKNITDAMLQQYLQTFQFLIGTIKTELLPIGC